MTLQIIGLRHQTATLDLREQLAFVAGDTEAALAALKQEAVLDEVAILSTCNRTEIYISTSNTAKALTVVARWLQANKGFDWQANRSALFIYSEADAVRHLFRVASGLNSLIIGEGQILGQVKDALRIAQTQQSIGVNLDRLFKAAIATGKRVRTETGITERDTSVSYAAYAFAKEKRQATWQDETIAVVGGGKMASLILEKLSQELPRSERHRVSIVNRSPNRLDDLCQRFGFTGVTWEAMDSVIERSSVLFVATGAPHLVLFPEDFIHHKKRALIIDISVPRNVEPSVGQFEHIDLYNTDDLAGSHGLSSETEAEILMQAEAIVLEAGQEYRQWRETLPLQQRLANVRQQIETMRLNELQRSAGLLNDDQQAKLDQLSRNLIKKLLHAPAAQVRDWQNPLESPADEATELLMQWFSPTGIANQK